jgi:hypothetical protein
MWEEVSVNYTADPPMKALVNAVIMMIRNLTRILKLKLNFPDEGFLRIEGVAIECDLFGEGHGHLRLWGEEIEILAGAGLVFYTCWDERGGR